MKINQNLVLLLLPIILMNNLIFSISSLVARDTQQVNKHAENISVQKNGTQFFKDDEGSTVQLEADGTKIIKKTDGTIVKILPDGSKYIKDSKGTEIQIDANGKKTIKKSDGSSIQVNPKH